MKLYILITVLLSMYTYAQSYSDWRARYDSFEENDLRAFQYITPYIAKAKKERNGPELVQAYKDAVSFSEKEKLQYADSMIVAARQTRNPDLIAGAYITKGTVFYFTYRKFQPALDEFLKAWKYAGRSGNNDLYYKNLYYIGVVKSYLGYYSEALQIFTRCRSYFAQQNFPEKFSNLRFNRRKGYLNTLHQMGVCLIELKRYDEASAIADLGLKETVADADFYVERSYFYKLKGITYWMQGSKTAAVEALDNALPGLLRKDDFTNASLVYYYKGLIARSDGDFSRGQKDFIRIDSVFRRYNFILPEVRPAYEYLIKEAAGARDQRAELYYTAQLLKADRVIATDFKYLAGKIHREYDTFDLLYAKRRLELSLYRLNVIIGFLALVFGFGLYRFTKKWKGTRGSAASGAEDSVPPQTITKSAECRVSALSDTLVQELLVKIDSLEKSRFFLDENMSQAKMAKLLKTNTAYLSELINEHKGCNFNTYMNRLRINYVTEMLREDRKWRKYTVTTLAKDSGFAHRSTFSQAFIQYHNMTPGAYITGLQENENTPGPVGQ